MKLFAQWLQKNKLAEDKLIERIQSEVAAEIKSAVDFALTAPYPAVDEVDENVYA